MKKEMILPIFSTGCLLYLPFLTKRFSSRVKQETRKKQNGLCPITGQPIDEIHHKTPLYKKKEPRPNGKNLNRRNNALGVSTEGHAIIHTIRAIKARRRGLDKIAVREFQAAEGAKSRLNQERRERYEKLLAAKLVPYQTGS